MLLWVLAEGELESSRHAVSVHPDFTVLQSIRGHINCSKKPADLVLHALRVVPAFALRQCLADIDVGAIGGDRNAVNDFAAEIADAAAQRATHQIDEQAGWEQKHYRG